MTRKKCKKAKHQNVSNTFFLMLALQIILISSREFSIHPYSML